MVLVNTRTWLELRLNNDYRVTGQLQLCPRGNTGDQVQVQRLFFLLRPDARGNGSASFEQGTRMYCTDKESQCTDSSKYRKHM